MIVSDISSLLGSASPNPTALIRAVANLISHTKTTLSLIALCVICIVFIAWTFFREGSERARAGAFGVLILAAGLLIYRVTPNSQSTPVDPPEPLIVSGLVENVDNNKGLINVSISEGEKLLGHTDTGGSFRFQLPDANWHQITFTKDHFGKEEMSISAPLNGRVIKLKCSSANKEECP
jgi:hypothetical protein